MISIVHGLKEYHLEPKVGAQYSYRFETIVTDFTNVKRPTKRSYIRNVEIMPIGKEENLDVYQIFTSKIQIKSNTSIPDEYLLKQLGYAFDELEIGVDYNGKIVRVFNLKDLFIRWNLKCNELENQYEGAYISNYFRQINRIFETEQKLLSFLSTYKMFGLYFHGLFGNYLLWEMPIKREMEAEDFENILVKEKIFPEKRDVIKYKIEGEGFAFEKYEGELIYNDFQLQEALIECINESQSITYGALFLG